MTRDATPNDKLIRMAWEDRSSFEEIERTLGSSEKDVIRIMRRELKPRSFQLWRKRVSGRSTKHQKRFRATQQELKAKPRNMDWERDP